MRTSTRDEYRTRIEQVVQVVLDRLDEVPSPQELADHAGFSYYHFGRIFSGATGESLAEFVRRMRLERAAWHLLNSETTVGDQALDAGYSAVEAFSRAFRAGYHVSPSDFRARATRHELPCLCGVHWHTDKRSQNLQLVFNEEPLMEIATKILDPMRVIAFAHVGPYHEIGPVFGRLFEWASTNGAPIGMGVGVYYNDPSVTPPDELRSHAAMLVPDSYEPNGEGAPEVLTVEGGRYAVATHMGPYEGLTDAWQRFIGQAVPAAGHELADAPPFEMYMNDCDQVPPAEVRTDLYAKIK